MLNGSGLRVVLWVSGCEHKCPKCQNPQTWPISSGIHFGEEEVGELRRALAQDYIAGLTLSGGDPLHANNLDTVTAVVQDIRRQFPDKTIWLYTGSRYEEVCDLPVVCMVDVLVDGEYLQCLRDENAPWVGSRNQRVIDIKQTLAAGQIAIWEDA